MARTSTVPTAPTAPGEEIVMDYCDRHGGYVTAGTTRPYEPRSRFNICADCSARDQRAAEERETYCTTCHYLLSFHLNDRCPEELDARAMAGDQ